VTVLEQAAETLLTTGSPVLGAVLVVLGWAYYKQGQALAGVQEARVADAKKVAETLLAVQDRWQTVVVELTEAVHNLQNGEREAPREPARRRP